MNKNQLVISIVTIIVFIIIIISSLMITDIIILRFSIKADIGTEKAIMVGVATIQSLIYLLIIYFLSKIKKK